jgi:predicted nucleic acid-binding protein
LRYKKWGSTFFDQISQDYNILCISSIAKAEIMIGVKDALEDYWNLVFEKFEVFPFTDQLVKNVRNIAVQLKRKSMMIDLDDMMIAATALEKGLPLATMNQRHFERIDGLELVTPN